MNQHIAWGSTVNPTDVTDVFQESVVVAGGVPVATISEEPPCRRRSSRRPTRQPARERHGGRPRRRAAVGERASTVSVETRHGLLIAANLSVQYTGFYATREPDYFRELARAGDVGEAKQALRYFDVGAQNWMFADDSGNIAYYTDHELPLREDLQAGVVDGLRRTSSAT